VTRKWLLSIRKKRLLLLTREPRRKVKIVVSVLFLFVCMKVFLYLCIDESSLSSMCTVVDEI